MWKKVIILQPCTVANRAGDNTVSVKLELVPLRLEKWVTPVKILLKKTPGHPLMKTVEMTHSDLKMFLPLNIHWTTKQITAGNPNWIYWNTQSIGAAGSADLLLVEPVVRPRAPLSDQSLHTPTDRATYPLIFRRPLRMSPYRLPGPCGTIHSNFNSSTMEQGLVWVFGVAL